MSGERAMTVREAGRKGGLETSRKHGPDHYQRIGKAGGRELARTHDHEHFVAIGKMAGRRIKELVALGKQAEASGEE